MKLTFIGVYTKARSIALALGVCLTVPALAGSLSDDSQGTPDSAGVQIVSEDRSSIEAVLPKNVTGTLLRDHIRQMAAFGPDAQQNYDKSLGEMRNKAAVIAPILFQSYKRLQTAQYFDRWLMVETMRELKHSATFNALRDIALAPLPGELWTDDDERFSVDKEAHIRVTAVDGLAALARNGNLQALHTLKILLDDKDLTIRRSAIRGYLAGGKYEQQSAFLLKHLSESDHWLVTLDTTQLKSVPQPKVKTGITERQNKNKAPPPRVKGN